MPSVFLPASRMRLEIVALSSLPEVRPGDDFAQERAGLLGIFLDDDATVAVDEIEPPMGELLL